MAYTQHDYPTKKAVREAVARRQAWLARTAELHTGPMTIGDMLLRQAGPAPPPVEVYQPGPFGPEVKDGRCALEGPHYPKPHSWYAEAQVKDGAIVSVK